MNSIRDLDIKLSNLSIYRWYITYIFYDEMPAEVIIKRRGRDLNPSLPEGKTGLEPAALVRSATSARVCF